MNRLKMLIGLASESTMSSIDVNVFSRMQAMGLYYAYVSAMPYESTAPPRLLPWRMIDFLSIFPLSKAYFNIA